VSPVSANMQKCIRPLHGKHRKEKRALYTAPARGECATCVGK
jgi:hypothetical protein